MAAHLGEAVLILREALVHLAHVALGVGEPLFRVAEGRVPRVEVALPLRDLLRELRIGAGERCELELQRFKAARGRSELFTQVTLAI